jgi:N-acetylglucosamine kinase-like BadF-type ATPase
MILIADSGSTKSEWMLGSKEGIHSFRLGGMNPFHTSMTEVAETLTAALGIYAPRVHKVFFYGSGCTPEMSGELSTTIGSVCPQAVVSARSDLVGAALALFGRNSGLAVILGTGSNCGFWDGKDLNHKTPSLGYIIGDEGSGADIGKRLAKTAMYNLLSPDLTDLFTQEYNVSKAVLLDKVYNQPLANRYLASFVPFARAHRHEPAIRKILLDSFGDFFDYHLGNYSMEENANIGFCGSVSWYFRDFLEKMAIDRDIKKPVFLQRPADAIIALHLREEGIIVK